MSPDQKYKRIRGLMAEVVETLGLDLRDDSLAETPHRIVRFFGQRPQVQERLTHQILVALQVLLSTEDVAVSIDATHYCVKSRGVMDTNSQTSTTALGGCFKENIHTRAEFLNP